MALDKKGNYIIDNRIYKGGQSDNLHRVLRTDEDQTFDIKIKSDSVAFQSYARIEVWDKSTNQWNHVYFIPYSEMASLRNFANGHEKDAAVLLEVAKKILA